MQNHLDILSYRNIVLNYAMIQQLDLILMHFTP